MQTNAEARAARPAPLAGAGGVFEATLDRLAGLSAGRLAFWLTAVAFAALMWIGPRLPMADLPQHAGQVALWRDLLISASPWSELLRINLATPYIVGYALTLPLSFVLPINVALTLVLCVSYIGFVAAFVALREELGADARLDWLGLPSFFGLAWQWGFFPFVVVAPVVVAFVLVAYRHVAAPTFRTSALLVGLGLVLLFGHGLAFLFAGVIGGLVVLMSSRSVRRLLSLSVPFMVLAAAFLAFFIASRAFGTPDENDGLIYGFYPLMRLTAVFAMSHGFGRELAMVSLCLALVPLALGLRFHPRAAVPFAVVFAWLMLMPHGAMGAGYFFERFGMFCFPFYLLMWRRAESPTWQVPIDPRLALASMVLAAWASAAFMAYRIERFSREAADFETVLAAAEPGKRAMSIKTDYASPAVGHDFMYLHFASWYQAEKRGLVDFNFAHIHNMIVRYKPGHVPPVGLNFEWRSHLVDWHRHGARTYDYFFVRHGVGAIPQQLIENGECKLERVATSGAWTLLARGACTP